MEIIDQQTQEQISDLVNACVTYWELRGIPLTRRDDMRLELEQHLQQAVYDGKALDMVVGPNPPVFAEEWAREMHPHVFRGGTMLLHGLTYALGALSTIALIEHLIALSVSFTLTLFFPYEFVLTGLAFLLMRWGGFLSPRIRRREGRQLLMLAIVGLPVVLLILVERLSGRRVNFNMALLTWNWSITVVLFVGAVVLFCLDLWLVVRGAESRPVRRAQMIRYAKMFAAVVALCDALLLLVWLVNKLANP